VKSDASDGRARASHPDHWGLPLGKDLDRAHASSADPDESDHDKSAGRERDSRGASAFRGEALPASLHWAGESISRLSPGAAEQSGAQPAVRQDSVWLADAAGYHRPWELPAESSPTEARPDEAWDGAEPAYWESFPHPPARAGPDVPEEAWRAEVRTTCPARADADRKEFDQAWGPAEKAGPESEFRAGRLEAQSAALRYAQECVLAVPKQAAGVAGPIVEPEAEQPRREPHELPVAAFLLPLHA
jgi:hypothetical protein